MNMIKNKHLGMITKNEIINAFSSFNFIINSYTDYNDYIIVEVLKDYSLTYNYSFNGNVKLKVIISKKIYIDYSIINYPKFIEVSKIIKRKPYNHISNDGVICYAPPERPLYEKWCFRDFVNSVDAMISDYFEVEYIGKGELKQLEHGNKGIVQYSIMKK